MLTAEEVRDLVRRAVVVVSEVRATFSAAVPGVSGQGDEMAYDIERIMRENGFGPEDEVVFSELLQYVEHADFGGN